MTYTLIPIHEPTNTNYVVCNDCGATLEAWWDGDAIPQFVLDAVPHYPTCKPGESERWAKYYENEGGE